MTLVAQLRPSTETAFERAMRLEREAATCARNAAATISVDLNLIALRCADLATLQSLQPGERDVLRQLAEKIEAGLKTISCISARAL